MVTSQAAIIITVPAAHAGGDSGRMQDAAAVMEPVMPNRKRRLAHLSMEEKQYRKKLKNRVAAQTSRDRKKQRMDELESSVVLMSQELEAMTKQNAALAAENTLLKQQLHDAQLTTTALLETLQAEKCSCGKNPKGNAQADPAEVPSISSRPAEGIGRETSRQPERLEDLVDDIPSLPELLADLGSSEDLPDLGDLERFAESLLQEAVASEENISSMESMVGKASEVMESCRQNGVSVIENMEVEMLPVETSKHLVPRPIRRKTQNRQLKQAVKKSTLQAQPTILPTPQNLCFTTGTPTCVTLPVKSSEPDILASAFNSAFSPDECITIIVPTQDETSDCVILGEAVQEVTTSSYLVPPFKDEPLSPRSDITEAVKSDCGYESFGSPHSDISSSDAMSDLWNESFTQLFQI